MIEATQECKYWMYWTSRIKCIFFSFVPSPHKFETNGKEVGKNRGGAKATQIERRKLLTDSVTKNYTQKTTKQIKIKS